MNIKNKKVQNRNTGWYLIWEHVVEHPVIYFVCLICIISSSILATKIPQIIGDFTDTYTNGKLNLSSATYFFLLIVGVATFRVLTAWLGRRISMEHGRILNYKVRDKLFKKWETLPLSYYHEHVIGDLLSHALNDVQIIQQLVALNGFNSFVTSIFILGGTLYVMLVHINLSLAIAGLGPLLVIPFIVHYYNPRIKMQSLKVQESLGGMSQSVEEYISGIRAVKEFSNEEILIERFNDRTEIIVRERLRQVSLSAVFQAVIPFVVSVAFVLVITYGGYLTIHKQISLGNFVSFLLYLILLKQPLEQLGNSLNLFQRGAASLARIAEILNAKSVEVTPDSLIVRKPIDGDIEVRNLSFNYPGNTKNVLSGISFKLKKGHTLGIIGAIGSGKTTLVNLLMRIHEPPRNTIFIDGIDIYNYDLKDVRNSIAFVPQNGFLFSTTIDANIAFSEERTDENKAKASAKASFIHQDILKLKEMYKTEVGEKGVRLSGGQKQRLAIARALYKDAPVNIFDDSLSAVDTKNERMILQRLRQGEKDKSNIIISHRLSAVMHADEILILENGKIADRGTHRYLLETNEFYNKLWNIQSGKESPGYEIPDKDNEDLIDSILSEEDKEDIDL